ncbi:hypothetical protein [Pontiella desulfatans]|nr:hypothetical protein [Pontiella desulfatans]
MHRLWGNGVYFVDDSGAYTCAVKAQPEFTEAARFDYMGSKPDGSFLICPVANLLIYPCQTYTASGLSAVDSPTPEQRINLGNYVDGRFVYLEHAGLGQVNIWYASEGNPNELWLDNSDFADLASILDYDGESLAFATGMIGDYDIQRRASDGTLTRIIGNGDAMPGVAGTTYAGTPDHDTVEIDQGTVYVKGVGSGGDIVLFSSDGTTTTVIAKVGQVVPGLASVTILGLELRQVSSGKIWVQVTQSDGDTVLYQISGGTWARVIGKFDNYVRGRPAAFDTYEHGSLGDTAVIAVTYLDFTSPTIYSIDLYTNADLPGISEAVGGGPMLQLFPASGGAWTIATLGEAGTTNTLQSSSSLTNTTWETVGVPQIADGTNLMEWTLLPTNDVGFFRLVE